MVEVMGVVLVLVYVERSRDVRATSLRRASKNGRVVLRQFCACFTQAQKSHFQEVT